MKKMKLFFVVLMAFITLKGSAQFVNSSNNPQGKTASSNVNISHKTDLNGWDRISVSFTPTKIITDVKGAENYNLTGFSIGYEKGFSIANNIPLFIETGGNIQYAFKNFDNEDLEDTNLKIEGIPYETKMTISTLNLKVPVNLAYKLSLGNVSIIPYVGINFKINLLAKAKYSLEDSDDLNSIYDSEDEYWESLEEREDRNLQELNLFDKKDTGSKDSQWKRFQMGWQIGVGLDYNKLHVGIGYGKDFMELYKKTKTSAVAITLGYNF